MRLLETEHERKSFILTTISFLLLMLLLYLLTTSNTIQLPELEGGGGGGEIAVNFGTSEFGSGKNFESKEIVTAAPQEVESVATPEKEILVSENEAAPAIAEIKKTPEKPTIKETVKEVIKTVPKPAKSTSDALSNLLNGNSTSGDGNDKTAGNKGNSKGNTNAAGYNGGGGTGSGSGGGNGSGQGIGSGSGYGSGSGSGAGNGNGNYQLGNRKALNKPQPNYVCDEQGIVVVQVSVDQSGRVISANPGIRGTTNAAKCLLEQAKLAAMNTKWNSDSDAPEKQVGKIIYSFKLR
jgi:outer membrane biosynthesis protein TonB